MSWDDIAQEFLPKLNQKIQKIGIQGQFMLPSKAQWEYAAAGGMAWASPKLEYAGSNNLNDVGWFTENSGNKSTFAVGLKQPNALGLYDMSGNVWERCQDDYKDSLATLPPDGTPSYGCCRVFPPDTAQLEITKPKMHTASALLTCSVRWKHLTAQVIPLTSAPIVLAGVSTLQSDPKPPNPKPMPLTSALRVL